MTYTTLLAADSIYACSAELRFERHQVTQPQLEEFYRSLQALQKLLAEEAEHDYWKTIRGKLKRYCFELCAIPLPFSHVAFSLPGSAPALEQLIHRAKFVYPQFYNQAVDVFNQALSLSSVDDNPLLDYLEKIAAPSRATAILVKDSRLVAEIELALRALPETRHLILASPRQLAQDECYDQLIVIGPARWYPGHLFRAPRARQIDLIAYDWLGSLPNIPPLLNGSGYPGIVAVNAQTNLASSVPTTARNLLIPSDELLPSLDNWDQVTPKFERQPSEQDETLAHLVLVEGDQGVFIDASEGATTLVIDLSLPDQKRVRRVSATSLEPDMFLLLRTSGGGDYIVPLANRIMGEQADQARSFQKQWKSALRKRVMASNLLEVSLELIDLGSNRANEVNVRNWMAEHTIKTEDFVDFNAIMQLVGLGERAKECWEVMVFIHRAHHQAGTHIRKLLLKRVLETDLRGLEQRGTMDFELSDADGGSLTACRILAISPKPTNVPTSCLASLTDLSEQIWQG